MDDIVYLLTKAGLYAVMTGYILYRIGRSLLELWKER